VLYIGADNLTVYCRH